MLSTSSLIIYFKYEEHIMKDTIFTRSRVISQFYPGIYHFLKTHIIEELNLCIVYERILLCYS